MRTLSHVLIITSFIYMVVLQEMSWLRRSSLLWSAWKRLMANRENCAHSYVQWCCQLQFCKSLINVWWQWKLCQHPHSISVQTQSFGTVVGHQWLAVHVNIFIAAMSWKWCILFKVLQFNTERLAAVRTIRQRIGRVAMLQAASDVGCDAEQLTCVQTRKQQASSFTR